MLNLARGTAVCVLASRLSEEPQVSVLLLERSVAHDTWMSQVPLISSNVLDPAFGAVSWYCEPMENLENRQGLVFCGEVLGGGLRVNSMVYTRGSVADFDVWSSAGYPEWSYEKVLPYLVKGETQFSQPKSTYRENSVMCDSQRGIALILKIRGPWTNQAVEPSKWPFRVTRV